jgi:hypothetical protein
MRWASILQIRGEEAHDPFDGRHDIGHRPSTLVGETGGVAKGTCSFSAIKYQAINH